MVAALMGSASRSAQQSRFATDKCWGKQSQGQRRASHTRTLLDFWSRTSLQSLNVLTMHVSNTSMTRCPEQQEEWERR
jgi:hypothetical protein